MMRAALAVLALVAGAGIARADELARTIDAGIARLGKDARVSVLVRSVTTGETLYARDAETARVPASTLKVATTAAALEVLGAKFEHETTVRARGKLTGGTLDGDLVIRGTGDPSISRRFQIEDAPLLADWAREIAAKVKVVTGDVVADDREFERLGFHPDWDPREASDWYAAEVSALNLNDNCIDVEVRPEGGRVRAVARPETTSIALDVRATTTAAKKEHRLSCLREKDGTIRVTGRVWTGAKPFETSIAAPSPALLFATVLHERLAAAGVVVKGKPRLVATNEPEAQGDPLLVRRSPLLRALAVCNKRSQNLYAECLLKTLGRRDGAAGSWVEGAASVERWLERLGVPAEERRVRDGSGLSRENRLSARALVRALEAVAKGPNATGYADSLAHAGIDGTLERRLRDLPEGATFKGKTGTMTGVCSLAGLLELERGAKGDREVIAMAFIANGTTGAARARQAQDDAVRATVRLRAETGKNARPERGKRDSLDD